jgi:hypothetical protein
MILSRKLRTYLTETEGRCCEFDGGGNALQLLCETGSRIGEAMATRVRNGNEDLKAAIALLLNNQAVFVSHIDEDRQRFARIEKKLDEITTLVLQHNEILKRHEQMLQDLKDLPKMIKNLPEAIRQKIGFKQ